MNSREHFQNIESLPTIADVERDTGLSKDTLRVWERRYGFPVPLRDGNDERRYTIDQVQRLRLIRRLMDAGGRPAKLVVLSDAELECMLDQAEAIPEADPALTDVIEELFTATRQRQLQPLRAALSKALARHGLQRFVIDVMPGLLTRVGNGWLKAEIGVAEEHLLTEVLQNILRGAINALPPHAISHPHVLLTSLPEEDHGLGLLMVEALLESEHANCLPLGLRMPLPDIVGACQWAGIEIVAISVSAAYPPRKALSALQSLRQTLPPQVALWAGGAGAAQHASTLEALPNLRVIAHIRDTLSCLSDWRAAHPQSA